MKLIRLTIGSIKAEKTYLRFLSASSGHDLRRENVKNNAHKLDIYFDSSPVRFNLGLPIHENDSARARTGDLVRVRHT